MLSIVWSLLVPEAAGELYSVDEKCREVADPNNDGVADPPEVAMLEGMRDVLQPKLPVSQRYELERRLASALANENYELAAILRDELRQL